MEVSNQRAGSCARVSISEEADKNKLIRRTNPWLCNRTTVAAQLKGKIDSKDIHTDFNFKI